MRLLDPLYYVERKNQPQGGGGKGGSGGGGDADAMLEYGQKGLDLQKQIYDTNRQDAQPWYQTGTAAVGQLSKLLGLNGTAANANPTTRQGLIDQYKGQFTTGSPTSTSKMYVGPDGRTYDTSNPAAFIEQYQKYAPLDGQQSLGQVNLALKNGRDLSEIGFKPLSTGGGQNTDMGALNKYVDDLLAKQGTANESDPLFGSLAQSFGTDDFQTDPGYQFRLGEGQKALERKLNASGKTYSPEAAKALMGYNQDMGSNEYNNAYNRFNINQDNLFNRLATLSGFGQTASGQIANSGTNYANAATEQYNGMGNAVTSANLANKANNSSMFGSLLGAGARLGGAYLMSDERLKHGFERDKPFDIKNGHRRYKFKYDSMPEKEFIGVLAQQVMEIDPLAVEMMDSGYYAVDYGRLGFEMEEC